MVLAEALAERKDIVKRIGEYDDRVIALAYVEESEDETPNQEMLVEERRQFEADLDRLQVLTGWIQERNNTTFLTFEGSKYTIAHAIVLRDRLKTEHSQLSALLRKLDDGDDEYSIYGRRHRRRVRTKDEIKQTQLVDARELRKQVDGTAQQMRLLDIEIQKANWSVEM
jgi:hypothetical protein